MGDVKHTKGPWRIQMLGAQQADLISGGTFMGLTGGSGAPFEYEPDDAAEWEANARLIAAAPDLVEALKWIAEDGASDARAVECARAALSKAGV